MAIGEALMITAAEIATAKRDTDYNSSSPHHEHDDCIRIAYEWLDAQKKRKSKNTGFNAVKHIIEKWAGRYVSQSDVEVAAHMHPEIFGQYPMFNLSSRLTLPSTARLQEIPEANTQNYREHFREDDYSAKEWARPS